MFRSAGQFVFELSSRHFVLGRATQVLIYHLPEASSEPFCRHLRFMSHTLSACLLHSESAHPFFRWWSFGECRLRGRRCHSRRQLRPTKRLLRPLVIRREETALSTHLLGWPHFKTKSVASAVAVASLRSCQLTPGELIPLYTRAAGPCDVCVRRQRCMRQ